MVSSCRLSAKTQELLISSLGTHSAGHSPSNQLGNTSAFRICGFAPLGVSLANPGNACVVPVQLATVIPNGRLWLVLALKPGPN